MVKDGSKQARGGFILYVKKPQNTFTL